MFGKKAKAVNTPQGAIETIIGIGAVLDGPFSAKTSTRLDGEIKGNVTIEGNLVMGKESKVTGDISAQSVYVAGEVTGNINAPEGKVEISDTGKVNGDIVCSGIIIDENAVFTGKCEMKQAPAASEDTAAK
jgi:cytoskeletal protein CcmA (bactofilin family)